MDNRTSAQRSLRPARLGRVLRRAFRDIWDYLGLVLVSSLIWSVCVVAPIYVAATMGGTTHILLGAAVAWVISIPVTAGIFRMAHRIVWKDDASIRDIWDGFGDLLVTANRLMAISVVVMTVLITDAVFFFSRAEKFEPKALPIAVGMISLYVVFTWLLIAMYQLPILAAQRPFGQREGALRAIRKAWLLAVGNPVFTIELFVVILAVGILCAASAMIGMLILYAGATSIILTHALRELYVRYGVVEEPEEALDEDD